jgi:hypothetical protein
MKQAPTLFDYGQWTVLGSILACMAASWSRLSDHQLWQDLVIIVSGLVIGVYGVLLVINWHGITDRYIMSVRGLGIRSKRRAHRFKFIRMSGALLIVGALAAIMDSIFWIVT